MKNKILISTGVVIMVILLVFKIPFSINATQSYLIQETILRITGVLLLAYVLNIIGYKKIFRFVWPNWKAIILLIPAFIVSINNFPISAAFRGRITITEPLSTIILFSFFVLCIGLFEEIIFRGVILNLFREALPNNKKGILLALIYSSMLFSILHLFNIFMGTSVVIVLVQVGYTFLTGLMFGLVYLISKNIWIAVIMHAIYNFGGLFFPILGSIENQWDLVTIITTALLSSVIFIFYLCYYLRFFNKKTDVL